MKESIQKENVDSLEEQGDEKQKQSWLKRMGWGAFAFFFIKGLVWLAIFFGLIKGCS